MLDGSRVDTARWQVERDAAKHFDVRYDLPDEERQTGRGVVVVLQHDRTELALPRKFGHVERVDGSRTIVGKAVDVDVDSAVEQPGAIDLGWALPRRNGDRQPNRDERRTRVRNKSDGQRTASIRPVATAMRMILPQLKLMTI